jgi:hypothetical protein
MVEHDRLTDAIGTEQADVDTDRISFVRSFRAVRRQVTDQAAFPPETLIPAIARAVKKSHSRYKKKAPDQYGVRHDASPTVVVIIPDSTRQHADQRKARK